jgi:peptidoglycan/LPS O-acetylase OafA/YrhL
MSSPSAVPDTFHERYIPALDGIRGIAILAVLLHHCRFLLDPGYRFQHLLVKLFELGWCGVVLFFVLSGFLITGILLDSRTSPNYFSTFYVRRVLRIFPLYYGSLALIFLGSRLLHGLLGGVDPLTHINPWWYLGFVQNFRPNSMIFDPYLGPLWSLAVEEQFYLVWPLLVLLLSRRALTWVCAAIVPLSFAIRLHYSGHSADLSVFVNTFTPASLDALASGALVAIAVRSPIWRRRASLLARPLMIVCTLWFCMLAWRAGGLFEYEPLIQSWGITALTFVFASVIFVAATTDRGIIAAFLNLKGLRFTGKISYSLYVLHPIVMALVLPALGAIPAPAGLDLALNSEKIVLVLLASITVAAASWFYFEKPILGLKRYFRYGQPAAQRQPATQDRTPAVI